MSHADHTASFSFQYDTERCARIVTDAVSIEVGELAEDRAHATVSRDGSTVTVTVHATDLIALRAGTNSWLRLVSVADSIADMVSYSTEDPNTK